MLPGSWSEARITLKPRTEKVSVRKDNLEPVLLMNMDTKILNKVNTPCTKEENLDSYGHKYEMLNFKKF